MHNQRSTRKRIEKTILGFVDDTKSYSNQNKSKGSVLETVKYNLTTWKSLIEMVAGKLNTVNVLTAYYNESL